MKKSEVGEIVRTPGEWARIAGIDVANYDGFLDAYGELTGINGVELGVGEYMMRRRAIIPEYILCTRKAFNKAIGRCSIYLDNNADFKEIADVAPSHSKHIYDARIYYMGIEGLKKLRKTGNVPSDFEGSKEEFLKYVISLLEDYKVIIDKDNKFHDIESCRDLSEITDKVSYYSSRYVKLAIEKGGTVEGLQQDLINKTIKELEKIIKTDGKIPEKIEKQLDDIIRLESETMRANAFREVKIEDECIENPFYNKNNKEITMLPHGTFDKDGFHYFVSGMKNGMIMSMEVDEETYNREMENQKNKNNKKKKEIIDVKEAVSLALECTETDINNADEAQRDLENEEKEGVNLDD